jgi:thioredoxin-dependent peroxiredoxin
MAQTTRLQPGDPAPVFTLPDQDGKPVGLLDLAGQRVVIYFYPKDDTPGCTTEACQFNDSLAGFEALSVPVLGISPDGANSHQRFRAKHGLQFSLLSDPDHQVLEAYGAWGERTMYGRKTEGVIRSTFVVDLTGDHATAPVISDAWYQVRANGHAAKVLEALAA